MRVGNGGKSTAGDLTAENLLAALQRNPAVMAQLAAALGGHLFGAGGVSQDVVDAIERVVTTKQNAGPGRLLAGKVSTLPGAIQAGDATHATIAMIFLSGAATAMPAFVPSHLEAIIAAGAQVWVQPINGAMDDLMVVSTRKLGQPTARTFTPTVLATSPDGFWPLGEASGLLAADISGHGRNGTYVPNGGTILYGQAGLTPSEPASTAVHLDGVGPSYIVIPADTAINTGGSFSIMALMEVAVGEGFRFDALGGTATSNTGWFFHTDGGWRPQFDVFDGGFGLTISGSSTGLVDATALNEGSIYLLAAVYDQSTNTTAIYVNGTLMASHVNSGAYGPGAHDLWLFWNSLRGDGYTGTAQNVVYWARALSAGEITTINAAR